MLQEKKDALQRYEKNIYGHRAQSKFACPAALYLVREPNGDVQTTLAVLSPLLFSGSCGSGGEDQQRQNLPGDDGSPGWESSQAWPPAGLRGGQKRLAGARRRRTKQSLFPAALPDPPGAQRRADVAGGSGRQGAAVSSPTSVPAGLSAITLFVCRVNHRPPSERGRLPAHSRPGPARKSSLRQAPAWSRAPQPASR